MPIPSAENTYASPVLSGVRPGPYMATLAETTVDPRGQMAASSAVGPIALMVLEGRAEVSVGDDRPIRLERRDAPSCTRARASASRTRTSRDSAFCALH